MPPTRRPPSVAPAKGAVATFFSEPCAGALLPVIILYSQKTQGITSASECKLGNKKVLLATVTPWMYRLGKQRRKQNGHPVPKAAIRYICKSLLRTVMVRLPVAGTRLFALRKRACLALNKAKETAPPASDTARPPRVRRPPPRRAARRAPCLPRRAAVSEVADHHLAVAARWTPHRRRG